MAIDLFNGPIPGENYTTDTRNFPWHRPPDFTSSDQAIEYLIEKMMDDEVLDSYLAFMDLGISLTDMATMICMAGISGGRWSTDLAILLAGPVTHILRIMARANDVEYEMGYEAPKGTSRSLLKAMNEEGLKGAKFAEPDNPSEDMLGSPDEQGTDLGENPEEAEVPNEESPDMGGLMGAPDETGGLV